MAIELWEPRDLFELRQDMRLEPVPDYFWRTFFNRDFYSEDRKIRFADLPTPHRKLAPYVQPTSQGKPIFERKGETVTDFEPAYIKVKDPVRVMEARNVLPSEIWREGGVPSLQARFDKRVADVTAFQLRAIDMTKAWMAARSFIDGKVTIKYAADQGAEYPEVTIDFGRSSSLNETLTGTFIDDPDYDLIGLWSDMSNTMYNTTYGGRPTTVIMGSSCVPYVQKNNGIKELLKSPAVFRGGEDTIVRQGMLNIDQPMSYIGTIGGIGQSLELWTYKDTVQAPNGTAVDILDPRDMLMIAPGAGGVMAHGAIYDVDAFEGGGISTDVFGKMFKTNDPGDMYVMHQSSPLAVNTQPNKVAKIRALA